LRRRKKTKTCRVGVDENKEDACADDGSVRGETRGTASSKFRVPGDFYLIKTSSHKRQNA
jgi:hypothetical protein